MRLIVIEKKLLVTNGGREGNRYRGVQDLQIQATIYKTVNNKVLVYSTGSYMQYHVIKHNGKECEKEYM